MLPFPNRENMNLLFYSVCENVKYICICMSKCKLQSRYKIQPKCSMIYDESVLSFHTSFASPNRLRFCHIMVFTHTYALLLKSLYLSQRSAFNLLLSMWSILTESELLFLIKSLSSWILTSALFKLYRTLSFVIPSFPVAITSYPIFVSSMMERTSSVYSLLYI